MCHYAHAQNKAILTNNELAIADRNIRQCVAVGYSPLIATTAAVGVLEAGGIATGYAATSATTAAAACADGDCSNEAVSLYRAVSDTELDDIITNQAFKPRPGGGSLDAKWFWEGFDSAQTFLHKMPDLNNVVQVSIPQSILNSGYRVNNLDNLGPAVSFIDDALNLFNQSIISIQQILSR